MKTKYKKNQHPDRPLKQGQYWDTVQLDDGGLIRVIKLKKMFYPKGY